MMRHLLCGIGVFFVFCAAATAQQAAAAKPAFTLADVHESPRRLEPFSNGGQMSGDRYNLRQSSIVDMVALAYGISPEMVQGGPIWIEMKRFDITAKADPKTSTPDLKLMLQSLLEDRFKLKMHQGEAPMPTFIMTAPGGKTKMKHSEEGAAKGCEPGPPDTAGGVPLNSVICKGMTADDIATILRQFANAYITEPVVNQTGLEGTWDVPLKWTDIRLRAKAGAEAISIFDCVEKDLGLKLEMKTAPRPVWIVDNVNDKPTPNLPSVSKELPPLPPAQFEVATIKLSPPDAEPLAMIRNGQMNASKMSMRFLLTFAWDLNANDKNQLVNAPEWIDEPKFDILAKAAAPENSAPGKPVVIYPDEFHEMLQALIKERFKLQVHWEDRTIDAYTLVADHPKLKEADPKSRSRCRQSPGPDGKDPRQGNPMLTAIFSCQNVTIRQMADELAHYATGYVYTPPLDKTGLTGTYDFTLAWSSASLTILKPPPKPGEEPSSEPNGALTLYDAVNKQLGLKMVKDKRPVPVLVIDHIDDKPTDN